MDSHDGSYGQRLYTKNGCSSERELLFWENIIIRTVSSEINTPITVNSKYEYETKELYAQRGENQIFGLLYLPQNAGEKLPTIIFSHGFGGNYQVGEQDLNPNQQKLVEEYKQIAEERKNDYYKKRPGTRI